MHYPESVDFLYSLGNEIRTVKPGLDAIRTLLAETGNPQDSFRIVHVAGTNGKGSTCAMIESGLRAAGYKTGLYTSPHLVEPTERVQIAGAPVSRELFLDAFHQIHQANDRLLASGALETHTTYFETVTAMGFLLMQQAGIDIAIVEVGLGGRLDATNIVEPELCVITPVDFDHEAYLGNSLELIAGEKAGILKDRVPAVFSRQRSEVREVLTHKAKERNVPFVETSSYAADNLRVHARGCEFRCRRSGQLQICCPLAGEHQAANALTAVAALEALAVPVTAIETGIARVRWPGRLQVIQESPEIVIDGAHNPAGARALKAHIQQFYAGRRLTLIYGAMRDKSVEEIIEILFPLADEVVVTAPDSLRAVRPEALQSATDHPNVRVAETASEALAIARAGNPEDVAVITGSLYLVGEILATLQ